MERLYKRSKTGAILEWVIAPNINGYSVGYGQHNGKIQNIVTLVKAGKQKRTVEKQIEFEMNACIKEKKDEGYKSLEELIISPEVQIRYEAEGTQRFLQNHLPIHDTTKNGHLRPMLAKTIDWKKVQYPIAYEDKLDGVRCNMLTAKLKYFGGIEILSLAREGGSYDFGTLAIRLQLGQFFSKYPDVILDGELYLHGTPQNRISGAMRSKSHKPEHEVIYNTMEYHVYDMIDTDMTYKERKEWLQEALSEFDMPLIKFHGWHIAESKEMLDTLEELSIADGYEGGMAKLLNGKYEPGKRSWNNMKIKQWEDEEFEIVGYELGKRGVQDLVFVLSTKDGNVFKATACGTIAEKEQMYKELQMDVMANLPNSNHFIGKMGTVKYKFLSEYGVPNHNTFKGVRDGKN